MRVDAPDQARMPPIRPDQAPIVPMDYSFSGGKSVWGRVSSSAEVFHFGREGKVVKALAHYA